MTSLIQNYSTDTLSQLVATHAHPLTGANDDYDTLLDFIGDAHVVLLGEASHGSEEFYRERARITQRLITEKHFTALAVEADWPDAWRVNHFLHGYGHDGNARVALDGFRRFPYWMWRNAPVEDFLTWLKTSNKRQPSTTLMTSFFGLDLYSLCTSMQEVLRYLDNADPPAAKIARARYACLDHFNKEPQLYGHMTSLGLTKSCEDGVMAQLQDLFQRSACAVLETGESDMDALFHAQQNARLVVSAENYYRTMFYGRISSWNLRDQHMADTLGFIANHLTLTTGAPPKIVIWAHNSHIGDARATDLGLQGELSLGQIAREKYGLDAVLIGFTTYQGNVTAARDWDAPAENMTIRHAQPNSYEAIMHGTGIPNFVLPMRDNPELRTALSEHRLSRAIGVIYRPATERQSHYFYVQLARQFDAIIHCDNTHALKPLDAPHRWSAGEVPGTFPIGV